MEYTTGCEVGPWSDWSNCTVECDDGEQNRTRTFIDENDVHRDECNSTILSEEQPCNTDPCDSKYISYTQNKHF